MSVERVSYHVTCGRYRFLQVVGAEQVSYLVISGRYRYLRIVGAERVSYLIMSGQYLPVVSAERVSYLEMSNFRKANSVPATGNPSSPSIGTFTMSVHN